MKSGLAADDADEQANYSRLSQLYAAVLWPLSLGRFWFRAHGVVDDRGSRGLAENPFLDAPVP